MARIKSTQKRHLAISSLIVATLIISGCGSDGTSSSEVNSNEPNLNAANLNETDSNETDPNEADSNETSSNEIISNENDLSKSLGTSFKVDESLAMILYNGEDFEPSSTLNIDTDDATFVKGKRYEITYNDYPHTIYRTELPIVSLDTADVTIVDEPKVGGDVVILESGEEDFKSTMGIELRGNSSQAFPKKSFSLELWEDLTGEDSYKEKLLNLRNDDDWILDGLWNEPLRLRDFVSHSLWLKMGRYPYSQEETDITFGIEKKFTELFLNGNYRGVYYLSEKIDRKQLGLKKYDEGLTGELYKGDYFAGGVTFDGLEPFTNNWHKWNGYEAKYPDEIGEIDWSNLYSLVEFVVNTNKITFDASILQRVDLENMADYYIFLNMIYATDNTGKNVYTGRYDQSSPYFFVPWDMDGSFGNDWSGERTNITDEILTNGLYNRLIENNEFRNEVKTRWNSLKTGVLSVAELQSMFTTHYDYLKSNGVYEREALNPELPQLYSEQEISFIHGWIDERFTFLDSYFNGL